MFCTNTARINWGNQPEAASGMIGFGCRLLARRRCGALRLGLLEREGFFAAGRFLAAGRLRRGPEPELRSVAMGWRRGVRLG